MYYNNMLIVELVAILSNLELEIHMLFDSMQVVERQSYRIANYGWTDLARTTDEAFVGLYDLREAMQDEAKAIRLEIIRQEDEMDYAMNYYEDELNILIAEDAYAGITDQHGDRRVSKDLMNRTISPKVWMRHGNSRISKVGKTNFKRLHREHMLLDQEAIIEMISF